MNTWRRQGRVFGPVLRDMYGVEVDYVHAVQRADGQVLLLPPDGHDGPSTDVLDGVDGLVLIGGEDLAAGVSGVDPASVGENASAARDRWEIALLDAALERGLPVLAICRGLQLLNAARGGTLLADISGRTTEHPPVPNDREGALAYRHRIELTEGSLVARPYGTAASVNSLHHQAIDRLGEGLVVTARAADGGIEAVELPSARWCVGVQWHPELMPEDSLAGGLFREFLSACRTDLAERRP